MGKIIYSFVADRDDLAVLLSIKTKSVPATFQVYARDEAGRQDIDFAEKKFSIKKAISDLRKKNEEKMYWSVEIENNIPGGFRCQKWERHNGVPEKKYKRILNIECNFETIGEVQHFLTGAIDLMKKGKYKPVGTSAKKLEKSLEIQLRSSVKEINKVDPSEKIKMESGINIDYSLKY